MTIGEHTIAPNVPQEANDNFNANYIPYYVYVIAQVSSTGKPTSPVKIGISKDVKQRLTTLQTSVPFRIEDFFYFTFWNRYLAQEIEKHFHNSMKANRLYGEWFDMSPPQATLAVCDSVRSMIQKMCFREEEAQHILSVSLTLAAEYYLEKHRASTP